MVGIIKIKVVSARGTAKINKPALAANAAADFIKLFKDEIKIVLIKTPPFNCISVKLNGNKNRY